MRTVKAVCLLVLVSIALSANAATSRVVRAEGKGYLEQVGTQHVLHLAGTPYEMGWQHGRLCADAVRKVLHAFLHEFAIERGGLSLDQLRQRKQRVWPFVPESIRAELRGLADGAGMDREVVELAHVVPWDTHCSGAAAWGNATSDHKLYQSRSFDFRLDIGRTVRPQDHALLIVASPAGGLPHAYASWAGYVGVVTGMNTAGISIGVNASPSRDRTERGLPVPFALKQLLAKARTLDQAVAHLRNTPHLCGWNFLVGDGKLPAAVVVEATPTHCKVMHPSDEAAPPHLAIPHCVRRTNHFVHATTTALQRTAYDPAKDRQGSWLRYWSLSQYLVHYRGRLDARRMVDSLREYQPDAACLHQAVFCPSDRVLWLAQAVNPAHTPNAGAQNQAFVRYPMADLVAGRRIPVVTDQPPTDRRPPILGTCQCADTLKPLSDPDPTVNKLLARFNFPAAPFPWRMRLLDRHDKYDIYRVLFPSPVSFEMLDTNTVHADYYVPRPAPRGARGVLVLHILADGFVVARMIARNYAAGGLPCLVLHLPYYSARRVRGTSFGRTMVADPQRMFQAIEAAVVEARRAACWLQKRPETTPDHLGLIGVSLGAIVGSTVIGVDSRFDRNVLVIGGGDPAAIVWSAHETRSVRKLLSDMGLTLDKLRKLVAPIDSIRYAHRVDPAQVLMINATLDNTIPRACTIKLWEALRKPTILWYPVGHYSIATLTPVIISRAFNFLNAPSPPAPAR